LDTPAQAPSDPAAGLSKRPLSGVTVIDLGQIYNGPYATFLMAMAGACVIKVEPPEGEKMRRRGAVGGAMLPFAMLNSNKEFVTLNLKSERGLAILREMVSRADILLENFAPGTMDRLGVGPESLLKINPKLIYAAGTGYGSFGPNRNLLAMDLTVQAMSGAMASTGYPDRPPVKCGPAICDFFGGIHLYGAVMTALFARERTGEGRVVEVSMLESVYPSLGSTLGLYFGSGGQNPPRTGNRHGGLAESPYNVYSTQDGWLALICTTDKHWESLLDAMGREDLKGDERFVNLGARVRHIETVDQLISDWSSGFKKEDLSRLLEAHRVPNAPVREIDEVIHDPHMHARGTLRHVQHPDLGDVILPTGAMMFTGTEDITLTPSKGLGADNARVYGDWLGFTQAELKELADTAVI